MQPLTDPFLHIVIDDFVPAELCRAACAEWPDERWQHWLRYDGERGTKFATRDALRVPPICQEIIRDLLRLPLERLTGLAGTFPDANLYGAGMHWIPAGGALPLHLDGDHNPVTGWERAASALVYVSPCEGGDLQLWDAAGKTIVKSIAPQPGRLVVFECGDNSWHSVAPVTGGNRLSLSSFFWRLPRHSTYRRARADFREASGKLPKEA